MSKNILIVSQSHLSRNPRVLKEATALADNGYNVSILTAIYNNDLYQEDLELLHGTTINYQLYSDLRNVNFASIKQRLIRKIAVFILKYLKFETKSCLGYNAYGLKKRLTISTADLYIMHQELATVIGSEMLSNNDRKIAFDIEDWYSEDLLPQARKYRPIKLLKKIESISLHKGIYCSTTSNALANKLAEVYKCKPPLVIYNVFPNNNHFFNKEKEVVTPLKLFWFSQTVGEGRGIENFIKLINSTKEKVELHLLGNVSSIFRDTLKNILSQKHHMYFHETVLENELAEKISSFDIGLALELTIPPSRNYTITNKFFQYLQSGLPIIASKTVGQNEIFENLKPGFQLSQKPDLKETNLFFEWLNNPIEIIAARQRAIKAAQIYNWEIESKKLLNLVKKVLEE
ncbi:glycosyltransferase family protein [Mucilaginibacter segetis]|uniref:Glycosyltransferase involved in cell wall biosynthesis n=1 Tax=Mucilaginibacter segetis TaxID=2793071 RepID=A0A934PSK6_9SPHI|nr:hypothetical protein [Mucilaginibacter segetis]MBK0378193.1 hypothetical protein [Mucilaginibacter segetis]